MSSRIIQLKDLDTNPNDLLFPITTGNAVSVTYGDQQVPLQSVVDLIPTADGGSGGGGSTQNITAKSVTLSPGTHDYISLNGTTYYTLTVPAGSTNTVGMVQLSTATDSTSNSLAATASAVKSAYDLAEAAIPKSIGTNQGDIIYFNSSGDPTRLAKGTAGQVLTMNSGATAPLWATPSGGVSTHSLLDSSVHTDTTTGSPASGNIIVGDGSKWTSQSFEAFASTYKSVPLVGHFDSTNFTAWVNACMNADTPYDNYQDVKNDNPDLNYITIDIDYNDIVSAINSGRPVYMLATADLGNTGTSMTTFKFVFEPRTYITTINNGETADGVIFSSACGYDIIGGVDVYYASDIDGDGNPGGSLILLPRLTGYYQKRLQRLPNYSDALAYQNIQIGSDTTKFLRNDGEWAVPAGGSSTLNQVTAVYNPNANVSQGAALYRADCAGNNRNFIYININSFPQGTDGIALYLDNAVPYTENYIYIYNGTIISGKWYSDDILIFDSSSTDITGSKVLPFNSSGQFLTEIPIGYTLWTIVHCHFNNDNCAMLTYCGKFGDI